MSLGSWKALTGIWLMRLRLSLRTCRVEPSWSRAPSSNVPILLLFRYLEDQSKVPDRPADGEGSANLRRNSQVFYPESCREAAPSQFADVVVAQIQSFH